ncbi:hypothetical protein [Vogesella indigofera]|uniref:hypothetical protein n=1 Tax=Vogesella indigofera TaxID=45465 RepID=UPI00234E7C22|nr:hypothetical protein [Vogesella indigofera]MDC7699518.1 hypothetical protein [Vogesella indigofera]
MFSSTKLRKALSAFALCCLGVMGMGITPFALADNPANYFQLDGDMKGGTQEKPDWSDVFDSNLPAVGATPKASLPSGFSSPTFVVDFFPATSNDNSLFATGSKDTLNITPGWQCKKTNNVNDKTDINNAYAVAYINPNNHLIVYFALDVASNDGTKDVGFWFLKDPDVSCPAGGGSTPFVGNHTDGDVLIVSEFTNGGRVSEIKAYRWNGGANGSLGTTAIASGGECNGDAFNVCAKVNTAVLNGDGANADVPWLVKSKTSNPSGPAYTSSKDLDIGMFFEGGIDLTAIGISGCFNRYLADTRSSTSLGATIFDFALGDFSNCSIAATKACTQATVNSDFATFTSPFTATVTNSSPSGIIYDVTINESFNFANTGETSCTITSNTGDQSVNGTELITGTPVKVASSLAPGASVTVGISCTGSLNSFQNAIHAVAGSAPGQSDITKDAVVSAASASACLATVSADLDITKACQGMQLVAGTNGLVALQADVRVEVTNPSTSNQSVTITTPVDTKVSTLNQVDCTTGVAKSDLVLSPNETACFLGSYNPTNADLVNPPSSAAFTDGVSVSGEGSISGTFTAGPANATCYLCDTDVDGIPDVLDLSD